MGAKERDGNYHKVELLSPAGSIEGFYGAVHAGADAVYLAGNRFGARAYAENFSTEALVECIHYAHLLGRRIYLAVNTLLKDSELSQLYEYLAPFCAAGLDAVIVQDLGVLRFVREHFPMCKLHVSTQMTLCSSYGASCLKAMGASRIVPARELSLKELIAMKDSAGVEIEAFIHGAMCYCYSGQCLFSSILGGRSGNRGRCAQPCRLPYSVVIPDAPSTSYHAAVKPQHSSRRADSQKQVCSLYPLSLKDMCTIEHIPALIEAGIDSFKIEGRMKRPEYTAGVTEIYRRHIDKYYELREKLGPKEAAEAYKVRKQDASHLNSLYIRSEVQDGYYFRRNGREMVTLDSPAYSESDEWLLQKIREKYLGEPLKLSVEVFAVFQEGQPAKVSLRHQDVEVCVMGEMVQPAQKQPITLENVRKQLGKMGDSAFCAAKIRAVVGEGCFYPLKQINELRREAVAKLEEALLSARGYGADALQGIQEKASGRESVSDNLKKVADGENSHTLSADCYAFSIATLPQLEALTDWLCRESQDTALRIYIDGDLILRCPQAVEASFRKLARGGASSCDFYAVLPYILREADSGYLEALYSAVKQSSFFRGFLVRSMDGLGFLQEKMLDEKEYSFTCRSDAGLYIWNQSALQEMSAALEGFCLPYECNAREQYGLLEATSANVLPHRLIWEKIVYGRIPMMITANCLLRTMGSCQGHEQSFSSAFGRQPEQKRENSRCLAKERRHALLRDRQNAEFPADMVCSHCMNIIYNSVPLSLHQRLSKWRGKADLRMDFTIESPEEAAELLDIFLKGKPFLAREYTTGHERRGAE